MPVRITSLAAAAVLSVSVALAGCSSTQSPQAAPAPSSEPSASAPMSPSTAPSPSTQTSSSAADDGDSSGKPAKAAIVAGLTAFYVKKQGLPLDKAKKFATCMVDELYDKASTTTLKGLLAGDPTKIDKGDAGLIAEAGNTCQSALS